MKASFQTSRSFATRTPAILAIGACVLVAFLTCPLTQAAEPSERPNILWITSEDNAAQWLGCYGNQDADTPRLDALASDSLRFTHAYSNAAVCAVARSTILNGAYAVTQGTQHMRSRYRIPRMFKPYVAYLREQGYYCTNNSKTDFNFAGDDRRIWDECSGRADYIHRAVGQPYFAIFNLTVSHESSLFPEVVKANRRKEIIPQTPRLDPDSLQLPPYVPDLPEVREDFAIYHDNVSALDRQVGRLLDELQRRGESENTIVFYYSDHGGPTPRGKRYLTDSGVRVPLIIHIPEKWRHRSPFEAGTSVDELVSFVDFAPTLLSLCGLEVPPQMQGRAFLGKHRIEPPEKPVVFLYADRFDEIDGMRRALTDGRFKYIRRFAPQRPAAPYSYYSLSMPSWSAWQKAWQAGTLSGYHKYLWETPQPVEELYDTSADQWEIHNLADDPRFADKLASMRHRLRGLMASVSDTGLIPEALFGKIAGDGTIYDYVHSRQFDQEKVLDLAFMASSRNVANLPAFIDALDDSDPIVRYWGAYGCAILGAKGTPATEKLTALLSDSLPAVRMTAACALYEICRHTQAIESVLNELGKPLDGPESILLANSLTQVDALDEVPRSWVEKILADSNANEYVRRLAERLNQRQ